MKIDNVTPVKPGVPVWRQLSPFGDWQNEAQGVVVIQHCTHAAFVTVVDAWTAAGKPALPVDEDHDGKTNHGNGSGSGNARFGL